MITCSHVLNYYGVQEHTSGKIYTDLTLKNIFYKYHDLIDINKLLSYATLFHFCL